MEHILYMAFVPVVFMASVLGLVLRRTADIALIVIGGFAFSSGLNLLLAIAWRVVSGGANVT